MESPGMGMVTEVKEQFIHEENLDWKPSTFKTEFYHHPAQLGALQPIQSSPPSPLSTISSYPSPQPFVAASPTRTGRTTERLSPHASSRDAKEERPGNPPYSILIYQALIAAEGNKLSLQDIYRWFEDNTDKGRDSSHKGWQNSIRHNLSMNAVCYTPPTSHMLHFEFTSPSLSLHFLLFCLYTDISIRASKL